MSLSLVRSNIPNQ